MSDSMVTQSGERVTPLACDEKQIHIEDIAHALSQLCRANGHTKYFYSVGQHCINCALEAKARGFGKQLQLTALLHDASEAYMADLIRPVKQQMPKYCEAEDQLLAVILKKYGLDPELPASIKMIDDAMLAAEFKDLVGPELIEYQAELITEPDLKEKTCSEIKQTYLKLFQELTQ